MGIGPSVNNGPFVSGGLRAPLLRQAATSGIPSASPRMAMLAHSSAADPWS